jgi:hypothetical protein
MTDSVGLIILVISSKPYNPAISLRQIAHNFAASEEMDTLVLGATPPCNPRFDLRKCEAVAVFDLENRVIGENEGDYESKYLSINR